MEADADRWAAVVRNYVGTTSDHLASLYEAAAAGRTAWKLLLDLKPEDCVLDVGSGTGLVASSIAPHVSRVVAMEFALPPLLVQVERYRTTDGGGQITMVLADCDGSLPFPDGAFDCVLVSSQPEWSASGTGTSRPGPKAEVLQTQLMAAERVLRPGGQLFWVGDNRLGHENWRSAVRRFFLRETDDRRPRTARSYLGYRRALRRAGFATARWFSLVGDSSFLQSIRPLKGPTPFWSPIPSRDFRSRLESHLASANRYGIRATKSGCFTGSLIERTFEKIESALEGRAPLELQQFSISRKDKVILTVRTAEARLIVRIPLTAAALESERVNARMLQSLASRESLLNIVPRSLLRDTSASLPFFVETHLPGRPLSSRLARMEAAKSYATARRLMDRVNGVSGSPASRQFAGERFETEVTAKIASLRRLGVSADAAAGLTGYFRERLYGIALPLGILHGDFSPSNILLDDRDEVVGLVDWEGGSDENLPILDALHYVESASRRATREHFGASIPRLANGIFASDSEKDFLMERYARWQIDPSHHQALVYLKWLRHMAYLSNFWLAYDQRRIDTIVSPVLREILNRG